MSTIRCEIVSAEKQIFSGEAALVIATGEIGELGIAPGHAPLITCLQAGRVVVQFGNGESINFVVSGGILEVQPKIVTVLVDTAVRTVDIDELAVRKAKEQAEQLLASDDQSVDHRQAERQLKLAIAQLQALQRMRRSSSQT